MSEERSSDTLSESTFADAFAEDEVPESTRPEEVPEAAAEEIGDISSEVGGTTGEPSQVAGRAITILEGEEVRHPEVEELPEQSDVREAILADVREYFAEAEGERPAEPTEAFIEDHFFDFSYLDRYREVERAWVNRPFAYTSVLYDPRERQYLYHVTEPTLDEFERYVRQDIIEHLRNSLLYRDVTDVEDKRAVFDDEVTDLVLDYARSVDAGPMHKLLYYLRRDFVEFGPIDPIMRDPAIEDISCDGAEVPVFVYHRDYRDLKTNVTFSEDRLSSYIVRLSQLAGRQISISDPLLDATLPDGSRLQLTFGEDVSARGSNFTIRKFSDVPLSPVDLVDLNTFSLEEMAYFWLAIENNKSLIFAGGTGSGKTTSMNAVSFFIPPQAKVVTIEDTREIDLPHDNWVQSVTRSAVSGEGRGEISMYELLQSALRQRPEYLLVGEIRTEERVALTFFQAMGTGHTAYTTMHADSINTVLNRLQNPPLNVPTAMVQDLDIIAIQRQTSVEDRRVRRNMHVTEVSESGGEDIGIETNTIFERDASTDTHERVGTSAVMNEVAQDQGWDQDRLEQELDNRKVVLQFLLEEGVTDYRDVAAVVHLYAKDEEYVLDRIRGRGYAV